MYSYVVPVIVMIMILAVLYILFRAAFRKVSSGRVEIVIDADSIEGLDGLILTAKYVAGKYFENADVYIRGSNEKYVDALCRSYGVEKKTAAVEGDFYAG